MVKNTISFPKKERKKEKNNEILFANVTDKNKIPIRAMYTKDKITNIKLNQWKNHITIYMISDKEDDNLTQTLELIEKQKENENITIKVFHNKEEASIILDSTEKGKIVVDVINEKERAIFNLLEDTPLFLKCSNKTISLLIIGCGNVGKEFLKDSIWCSTMIGYHTKILVIDKNANDRKEEIEIECPELLQYYDITFIESDIKKEKAIKEINKRKDIKYIVVSMDTDDKNIETAILLRRMFIKEWNQEPIINLWIENEYKRKQISAMKNEKHNSYQLNSFGSIEDLYDNNKIMNSELEKKAREIHLFYDPEDIYFQKYNLLESNKRSSRASALHRKYKYYSILQESYTEDEETNKKLLKNKYNKEIEEQLIKNEHERWNAYMRSMGYTKATIEEVNNYYPITHHYIHYLAKMHPAIVKYEELDKISKELSKITKKEINLKEYDKKIIKNIVEKSSVKE